MTSLVQNRYIRLFLACAFCMATGLFSAPAQLADRTSDADLLTYLESGGNLSDICFTFGDEPQTATPSCEVCNLISYTLTPVKGEEIRLFWQAPSLRVLPVKQDRLPSLHTSASRAIRAPPRA